MTAQYDQRIGAAAQGALQAIMQHGGGQGYSFAIRIVTNISIFVDVSYTRWEGAAHATPNVTYRETITIDTLLEGAGRGGIIGAAFDKVRGAIIKIEHAEGRCVA